MPTPFGGRLQVAQLAKEKEEHDILLRKVKSQEHMMQNRQAFGGSAGRAKYTQANAGFLPGPELYGPARMGAQARPFQNEASRNAVNHYDHASRWEALKAGVQGFGANQAGTGIKERQYISRRHSFHASPVNQQGQDANRVGKHTFHKDPSFTQTPQGYAGSGRANNNTNYVVPGNVPVQYPEQPQQWYNPQPQQHAQQPQKQFFQQTPQPYPQKGQPSGTSVFQPNQEVYAAEQKAAPNAGRTGFQTAPPQANNESHALRHTFKDDQKPNARTGKRIDVTRDNKKIGEAAQAARKELDQDEIEAAEWCWHQDHPNQLYPYSHKDSFGDLLSIAHDGFDWLKTYHEGGWAGFEEGGQVAAMTKQMKESYLRSDLGANPQKWPHIHERRKRESGRKI